MTRDGFAVRKGEGSLEEKEKLVVGDGPSALDGVAGAELVEAVVRIEPGELGIAVFHLQEHHLPADARLGGPDGILRQFKQLRAADETPVFGIPVLADLRDEEGGQRAAAASGVRLGEAGDALELRLVQGRHGHGKGFVGQGEVAHAPLPGAFEDQHGHGNHAPGEFERVRPQEAIHLVVAPAREPAGEVAHEILPEGNRHVRNRIDGVLVHRGAGFERFERRDGLPAPGITPFSKNARISAGFLEKCPETSTFGCGHGLSEHKASTKTRTAFGSFISKSANMLDVAMFCLSFPSGAGSPFCHSSPTIPQPPAPRNPLCLTPRARRAGGGGRRGLGGGIFSRGDTEARRGWESGGGNGEKVSSPRLRGSARDFLPAAGGGKVFQCPH